MFPFRGFFPSAQMQVYRIIVQYNTLVTVEYSLSFSPSFSITTTNFIIYVVGEESATFIIQTTIFFFTFNSTLFELHVTWPFENVIILDKSTQKCVETS